MAFIMVSSPVRVVRDFSGGLNLRHVLQTISVPDKRIVLSTELIETDVNSVGYRNV